MLDIEVLQVPVEAGLELGAVVGLDDLYAEGQPPTLLPVKKPIERSFGPHGETEKRFAAPVKHR